MRLLVSAVFFVLLPTAAVASAPVTTTGQPPGDPKSSSSSIGDVTISRSTIGDRYRVDASSDGSIGAGVSRAGVIGPVTVTTAASRPRCTHRPATYGEYPNVVPADAAGIPDAASQVNRNNDGRAETGWVRECAGNGGANSFYWAAAAVDPVDLLPDALASTRAQLPDPTPAVNPDVAAGGIVNLGMWLAVADPGTTTARATVANVWAQVTATVSHLEVDLGNGDTVRCEDLGTPIPESALDSADQGPCGYTYRRSSPDDDPYQLAMTTVHDIAWTTSDGGSGTLAEIRRTVTVGYDVDEIQTVGVSN